MEERSSLRSSLEVGGTIQQTAGGRQQAHEYRFPFDDSSFDMVILASVFTHLLPRELERYLSEICRVLKYGGRCVISYFLLNDESVSAIEAGALPRRLHFKHNFGAYRVQDRKVPEVAIAHDESAVRTLYEKHGLDVIEPVIYGGWTGREPEGGIRHNQDIVLASKAGAASTGR